MSKYGLEVQSKYDVESYQPVVVVISEGEFRSIERTEPGLLAISMGKNSKLHIEENINKSGLYHTYVYCSEKNTSVDIISNIEATKGEYDVAHKVFVDESLSTISIKTRGLIENESKTVYTSQVKSKKNISMVTALQAAEFLSLSEKASICSIPELYSDTKNAITSHKYSVSNIKSSDIEYLI